MARQGRFARLTPMKVSPLKATVLMALAVILLAAHATVAVTGNQQSTGGKQQTRAIAERRCPASKQAELVLGEASSLLQQAQYAAATEKLQPLARLHCDARLSLLLAAAYEGQRNIAQAEGALEQAQSVWPSNNSIAASLARIYMSSGQIDKAVRALVRFHPEADTPLMELDAAAIILLSGHQLVSANAVAQAAYNSYPSIHSLLLLANTLQLEGRYKDVIALLQDKRATYAQLPAFLVTLSESEYDADMLYQARQDLDTAIKLDPDLYQAQYLLGNVLMKQGELDQALSTYRTAISLAPDQPRTYYQFALALRAKQDDAGEESVLAKALALDSHYAAAHSEMGRMFLNENRLPEAVAQLNSAIEDNPALEQSYNLLARAYDRLGDTEKADAMAKRLVVVRSENHKAAQDQGKNQADQAEAP